MTREEVLLGRPAFAVYEDEFVALARAALRPGCTCQPEFTRTEDSSTRTVRFRITHTPGCAVSA